MGKVRNFSAGNEYRRAHIGTIEGQAMTTAMLRKPSRKYITGRGFITPDRLFRVARRNQRAQIRGNRHRKVLLFRTDQGVETIGLYVMEAWRNPDGSVGIKGTVAESGKTFEGSFDPKIFAGPINIPPIVAA